MSLLLQEFCLSLFCLVEFVVSLLHPPPVISIPADHGEIFTLEY